MFTKTMSIYIVYNVQQDSKCMSVNDYVCVCVIICTCMYIHNVSKVITSKVLKYAVQKARFGGLGNTKMLFWNQKQDFSKMKTMNTE